MALRMMDPIFEIYMKGIGKEDEEQTTNEDEKKEEGGGVNIQKKM